MNELKIWKTETPDEHSLVLRVPSTNATITVDGTGLMPYGNFRNMTSDEHAELIPALENALEAHKAIQAARAVVAKQSAAAQDATAEAVAKAAADSAPKKVTGDRLKA